MPIKIRRILTRADLWAHPCLHCGSPKDIEAEHAQSGIGWRKDEPWAIIPLCYECHRGGAYGGHTCKEFAKEASLQIKDVITSKPDTREDILDFLKTGNSFNPRQRERIARWSFQLILAL